MSVDLEQMRVSVGTSLVTAIVYRPADRAVAQIVLGHGAGANQQSAFMVAAAQAFAARGVTAVTFNFPYTEQGRRVPDKADVLERSFASVVREARARAGAEGLPFHIGGKSMGGRMATHLAATWSTEASGRLDGVVLFGYPLHPPGRPSRLRVDHLSQIRVPLLFLQGTRDTFGGPDDIREAFPSMPPGSTVHAVDGADHSFRTSTNRKLTADAVLAPLVDVAVRWMLLPRP
ncbi:MAG: alpha/beta family hydrolase [Vicinamibacterales bacterium]